MQKKFYQNKWFWIIAIIIILIIIIATCSNSFHEGFNTALKN